MIKGCAFFVVGIFLLIMIPAGIGIVGGVFGLLAGLFGAIFGIIAGIFGAIFGVIAWIFKSLFHLLFGWGHFGFHCNGFFLAAILILIVALAINRKK